MVVFQDSNPWGLLVRSLRDWELVFGSGVLQEQFGAPKRVRGRMSKWVRLSILLVPWRRKRDVNLGKFWTAWVLCVFCFCSRFGLREYCLFVCLFFFFLFLERIWNYITKIQILLLLLTAHVKHGNLFIDEVN